jgi:Cu-Zn family superoxide dismutase
MNKAICILKGDKVNGITTFVQTKTTTTIHVKLSGLTPGPHGFHIHQYGDQRNGCTSMGPHYNPFDKEHGGLRGTNRHVGDLGNLIADKKGKVNTVIKSKSVKLTGKYTVLGRGLVVHDDEDDLGKGGHTDSKTTGHSGARVACGIIAVME